MPHLMPEAGEKTAVYLHIPFCQQICYYCDFAKVMIENQPVDEYLTALLKELDLTLAKYPGKKLGTTYLGGGTPSALSARQLEYLLAGITQRIPDVSCREFSFEVNPGDLDEEKIAVLRKYGVNRISLGVQTFNDRLLKKIGRKHSAADVYQTLALLRQHDFHNLTIDLIYALPGQTLADFEDTLKKAIALDLPHYALYSLILENKTQFMNWVRKGRLTLPDDDTAADMYELAQKMLGAAGKKQYELSNFATPGFESQHNLVYWHNQHYFGLGAGASGYLGHFRYRNHGPIQHYLKALAQNQLPIVAQENLSIENQMEEEMFLGLRKTQGVYLPHFAEKFGVSFNAVYGPVMTNLIQRGLVFCQDEFLRLTPQGMLLGNLVFEEFLIAK